MLWSQVRRQIGPVLLQATRRISATKTIYSTARLHNLSPLSAALTAVSRNFSMASNGDSASFAFAPPVIPSVEIQDSSERFPVHRIYCVGRNYSEHVKEMGGDPKKSSPMFFTKPADAVVPSGSSIPYPLATSDLHYEVELVVCIGKGGVQIPVDQALEHIFGYAVGLDLTKRDLQAAAKSKGLPWDSSKAFDQSAPIGSIRKVSSSTTSSNKQQLLHEDMASNRKIQLSVNGQLKQDATLNQMIWSIPEIIHELSNQFYLQPGDLIFTGTPSGVGPIVPGDVIQGTVEGLSKVVMKLVE